MSVCIGRRSVSRSRGRRYAEVVSLREEILDQHCRVPIRKSRPARMRRVPARRDLSRLLIQCLAIRGLSAEGGARGPLETVNTSHVRVEVS